MPISAQKKVTFQRKEKNLCFRRIYSKKQGKRNKQTKTKIFQRYRVNHFTFCLQGEAQSIAPRKMQCETDNVLSRSAPKVSKYEVKSLDSIFHPFIIHFPSSELIH